MLGQLVKPPYRPDRIWRPILLMTTLVKPVETRRLYQAIADQICELIGMELPVILERASEHQVPTKQLTLNQEREIASDAGLFLITWLVLSRTAFEEIVANYQFSAAKVQQYLIRLDRLKVIELQPSNRVRRSRRPSCRCWGWRR